MTSSSSENLPGQRPGYDIVPTSRSSPGFIERPICSFTLAFRKRLGLSPSRARHAVPPLSGSTEAIWIELFLPINRIGQKKILPESLAAAVRAMSRTDLQAAGNEASQRVVQRYSWRRVFDRMFEIYETIRA